MMMKKKLDFVNAIFILITVFFGSFFILYIVSNSFVQDAYMKGYERGLNDSCKLTFPNQWKGDNPTNTEINISLVQPIRLPNP